MIVLVNCVRSKDVSVRKERCRKKGGKKQVRGDG